MTSYEYKDDPMSDPDFEEYIDKADIDDALIRVLTEENTKLKADIEHLNRIIEHLQEQVK